MTPVQPSVRSDCRQMEALLPPYVDGTASEIERARVAAHLDRCGPCRQTAGEQGTVRQLLRARHSGLCRPAPADLAAQVRAAALAHLEPPVLGWRGRLSAVAAAAAVVVAVAGVVAWGTGRSSVLLAAQLTLDHIKCFMIDGDEPPAALEAGAASNWLRARFGWSAPLPDSATDQGVQLVALRRCLSGEGMVAHALYRVHGAPVSLFVMPGTRAAAADVSAFGRHAEVIHRRGVTYVLVAPARQRGVAAALGLEAE